MLSELGVTTCTAAPNTVENTTIFSLFVPSGAKKPSLCEALKPGAIVVGDDDLICKGSGSVPLVSDLREKVMNISSSADASGGEVIVVTTIPAAVHECFEYAQLELFRGKADSLDLSRTARLDSLSAHGYGPPPDIFASTEQIVHDAKAATISVTDQMILKARLPSLTLGNGSVPLRRSRNLASIKGKSCGPCINECVGSNGQDYSSNGVCDDGGEGSQYSFCALGASPARPTYSLASPAASSRRLMWIRVHRPRLLRLWDARRGDGRRNVCQQLLLSGTHRGR